MIDHRCNDFKRKKKKTKHHTKTFFQRHRSYDASSNPLHATIIRCCHIVRYASDFGLSLSLSESFVSPTLFKFIIIFLGQPDSLWILIFLIKKKIITTNLVKSQKACILVLLLPIYCAL